jgi:hypothetical protein
MKNLDFSSLISIPSVRSPAAPHVEGGFDERWRAWGGSDDGIQEGRLLGGTVGMILMCLFLIWKYHAHMLHVCYIYLHVFRANVGKYSSFWVHSSRCWCPIQIKMTRFMVEFGCTHRSKSLECFRKNYTSLKTCKRASSDIICLDFLLVSPDHTWHGHSGEKITVPRPRTL